MKREVVEFSFYVEHNDLIKLWTGPMYMYINRNNNPDLFQAILDLSENSNNSMRLLTLQSIAHSLKLAEDAKEYIKAQHYEKVWKNYNCDILSILSDFNVRLKFRNRTKL